MADWSETYVFASTPTIRANIMSSLKGLVEAESAPKDSFALAERLLAQPLFVEALKEFDEMSLAFLAIQRLDWGLMMSIAPPNDFDAVRDFLHPRGSPEWSGFKEQVEKTVKAMAATAVAPYFNACLMCVSWVFVF
jgi:hypothetical protein